MILIANPIYNTVFKRLMENERVARFFISTLLNREVTSVKMMPQEFTYYERETEAEEQLTILRLDFMATVVTSTGERIKMLIEVQKAKDETDLVRLRGCQFGDTYRKLEVEDGKKTTLPIITIYVLDFELPEIPTACVKVGRVYEDLVNNVFLKQRSPFIGRPTHDAYVVQLSRITERYQTPLDKLLSIFEQANFVGDTEAVKNYKYDPDDADVKTITDILHHVGTDPVERKALDIEVEANRTFEEWLGKRYNEQRTIILEQNKKLAVQDAMIAALAEQEEMVAALAEQEAAIAAKRKALAEKEAEVAKLREHLARLERKQ
ncbi:MAG: hypothetical protein LBO71_05050 [Prevotellaceae bacterium]|jgi:uncharacterized coiled-coil protein SlyX|nr:hypothetical protein [Prevotellaceae bacterium]